MLRTRLRNRAPRRHRLAAVLATLTTTVMLTIGLSVVATPAHAATTKCDGTGLLVSGYDGTTAAWIPAYHSSNFNCSLSRGAHNSGVGWLQRSLNSIWTGTPGYTPLVVDNDFGGNTQKMLTWAQRQYGITADGIYGAQTRGAICWLAFNANACVWYHS